MRRRLAWSGAFNRMCARCDFQHRIARSCDGAALCVLSWVFCVNLGWAGPRPTSDQPRIPTRRVFFFPIGPPDRRFLMRGRFNGAARYASWRMVFCAKYCVRKCQSLRCTKKRKKEGEGVTAHHRKSTFGCRGVMI